MVSGSKTDTTLFPTRLNGIPCSTPSWLGMHPPCIYAGAVASAMGFGLCRSKMMNGIVALHLLPMRKDDVCVCEKLSVEAECFGDVCKLCFIVVLATTSSTGAQIGEDSFL
ncbi:hypothetical protein Tco_0534519 [Tanacetum coccineum]